MAPVVICGGTEPLCRITYAAFNALQAVDPEYCKPFDKNRQGLSLGEGSGIMILEALSHARQRGAHIYGEILGYGVSCDAHHMTAPDPEGAGAALAMRRALEDAGVATEAVDYINAHGTATPANDLMETKGIKAVFGRRAYHIPVSSTKSMIGHTLGAAGAIEGVVAVLAIHHHFIPPTIHQQTPDPQCDLDFVTEGSMTRAQAIGASSARTWILPGPCATCAAIRLPYRKVSSIRGTLPALRNPFLLRLPGRHLSWRPNPKKLEISASA
jgi:3-oxoacyl-[acyl-carrier-protein] synthase II